MQTEPIPPLRKIVEYQDSARLAESVSKILDVNNVFIQKLTEQLIETAADSGQTQQRIITQLLECFNRNVEATTASYCDNITNANEVFERWLDQNQKDVRFRKFFSISNKNAWSKKAWSHAFENYTQHVGMIGQAHRRYNESLALNYVQLVTSCLNLLTSGEQPKELKQNPVPLLTGMIVDAARDRGMVK